jgi:hypothetical protein
MITILIDDVIDLTLEQNDLEAEAVISPTQTCFLGWCIFSSKIS